MRRSLKHANPLLTPYTLEAKLRGPSRTKAMSIAGIFSLVTMIIAVACDSETPDRAESSALATSEPEALQVEVTSEEAPDIMSMRVQELMDDSGQMAIAPLEPDGQSCEATSRTVSLATGVDPNAELASLCVDESSDDANVVLRECLMGESPIGQVAGSTVQANEPLVQPVGACYWCDNSSCLNGKRIKRNGQTLACPWNIFETCCWSANLFNSCDC